MKKFSRIVVLLFFTVGLLTNCATYNSRSQNDTKLLIEYALYDFPFPKTSNIVENETVILGAGERWSGKVRFLDTKTPPELLKFYAEVVPASGWEMKSSTVSSSIFLVFIRDNRVATVEISRLSFLQGQNFLSMRNTSVVVSVNHADSIGNTKMPQQPRPNKIGNLNPPNNLR